MIEFRKELFLKQSLCLSIILLIAANCYGISEEEINFSNGPVSLSGTLILPETSKPHPAIVFLHGSGPSVRSEYRLYAEAFAQIGFAGLIFDKRGCGKSKGSWINSSVEDLANDAAAAIEFLKSRPEIQSDVVGIWAISQSGWVASILPSITEVPFLIVVTGGGATPYETEMYGYRTELNHAGISKSDKQEAEYLLKLYFDYLKTGQARQKLVQEINQSKKKTWYLLMQLEHILPTEENRNNWMWVATFDPMPYIKKMKMPALLLFGGRDSHTPTDLAMKKWEQGLREAGNTNFQIKLFPEASHAIRVGEDHGPANDVTDFALGYFETMKTWLKEISVKLSKE